MEDEDRARSYREQYTYLYNRLKEIAFDRGDTELLRVLVDADQRELKHCTPPRRADKER